MTIRMAKFRVGLMDSIMAGRPSVDTYSRASYLAAVVNRVDSYWVPDHINGQTPRPLWDPKYTASARLLRSPDAAMEAWTLLGSLAARRRFNRVRLGVGVTDTGKRHPAVTAQAAATLHLMTRGRAILGIGPGNGWATSPTACTGRSRLHGSRRRWPPSAPFGTPKASS
jgi:phthiodiolone/phenolphthiodiolone dimycocerosates ketoreductase